MTFNKPFVIFFAIIINLNVLAQTESFSSKNIDSLITAYDSHKKIGLPKAYCVDQIVRFYTTQKDFIKASKYNKEYKEISKTVNNNNDVNNRYTYRNAYLDFLISDKKKLDTISFTKAYKYFKEKDPEMCPFMASQMVSYLRGSDGFGTEWLADKEQLISWYIHSGEDHFKYGFYDDAKRVFYNASLNLSYKDSIRMETILRKAIISNEKAKNKITLQIYLRLTELYLVNGNSSKVLALEEEILALNYKKLESDFYSAVSFYKNYGDTEIITKKEKDKKDLRLKQLRDSSLVILLPEGTFHFDFYNRDLKKTSYSLNINQSTITKKSIDAFGKDSTEYEVHLSYPLTKNINLLSVKKTKETHESWEFIIMQNQNNVITINDNILWNTRNNSEEDQLESMNELLAPKNKSKLSEELKPRLDEYYIKTTYDSLCQFPIIKEHEIAELRVDFLQSNKTADTYDGYWFNSLLEDYSYNSKGTDSLQIALKHLLIIKGYQPFSSIPVIAKYENEVHAKPKEKSNTILGIVLLTMFLLGKNWVMVTLQIIAGIGVFWVIYKFIQNNRIKRQLSNSLNKFTTVIGIIGLVVLGCFLGSKGGWFIGTWLGYNGGESIIKLMIAIIGTPLGGLVGLVVGIFLSQKLK